MDSLKGIGQRIREARDKLGLKQNELAELVQISTPHMSNIENGKTVMGIDVFIRLQEALQVSADWLLQSDVPTVDLIHNDELAHILEDCTSSEKQAIIETAINTKRLLREFK